MSHVGGNPANGNGTGRSAPAANQIPPRQHYRSARRATIPPQPSLKRHTVRLAVATAIGLGVMLLLLMMAMKYAQRDWSQKNQRARASRGRSAPGEADGVAVAQLEPGWIYPLPATATSRQMRRLAADAHVSNWWLVMGRGLPDRDQPQHVIACLRLAMVTGGETAVMKNDFGAAYLQQRRIRQANGHFLAALQIEPGFPPAQFNLALCSIAERNPAKGSQLLARYLARRPDDTGAYRLQSTLLSQLGRPQDALTMLERFLKTQPPEQPLFLEAAVLAARLGQNGNALRYLETALSGNPIQSVVRAYQSPAFRNIRLSGEGDALASRMASRARVAFGAPLPVEELQPLRATPNAIVR
jgi:tetratricopeptide (TPR) repeat protein